LPDAHFLRHAGAPGCRCFPTHCARP
jgi:hypothetical protein